MATAAQLLDFAKQRHQAGDFAGAERLYREVLQAEPAHSEALGLLALACHQRGDWAEAESWYRRTLAVRPADVDAHFRLGMVLMSLFRPADAEAEFREAVRLRPDSPDTWNNLGNVLFLTGRTPEAIRCFRQAVRLRPDWAEACLNLGNALRENDHTAEGLRYYREAVRLRPDFLKAHMNLGAALLETGDTRGAEGHLRECLRLSPRAPKILSTLIANDLYSDADPGVDELRGLLSEPRLPALEVSHLHFTLARVLDKAGQYDEAFRHFIESNAIRRELNRNTNEWFDAARHSRHVDRLIAWFTPEWIERHRNPDAGGEELVFVVGMPRSGSTLVEQILSHHPDATGVGELRDLPRIVDELPKRFGATEAYPDCLTRLDDATTRRVGEEYLTRVHELARQASRVADKMLANFLHLGLIAVLFPKARVVHCRRDPLDTCVSCFMQIFRGLGFTLDLADLGSYYQDYERLMAHWRAIKPLPMLEVVYEELVADVEGGSRQFIEFCGLPWDERCLRFYENPRPVRTVSKLQVRQPVYKSALGRWRRYAAHLAPLRRVIGLADEEPAPEAVRQ
jgi:tetratricopeptide (TPR) repeat protein